MARTTVGIDASKATFAVAVRPSGERWTTETTVGAIDALVTRLQALTPAVIVLEATGGYEHALVAACAAVGLPVAVANPRQVRAFAQALGRLRRRTTSTRMCSPTSARACSRRRARSPTPRRRPWRHSWRVAGSWSR
jgi:transposase